MNIYFRTNLSEKVGLGHFSRCTRLYNFFLGKGHKCQIFLDKPSKADNFFLKSKKLNITYLYYKSFFKNQKIDAEKFLSETRIPGFVFVDDYRLDHVWEKKISDRHKIIVIEDLNDRKHYSNYIINSNPKYNYQHLYTNLSYYKNTKLLLGTDYAILNSNDKKKKYEKNITFYFGGAGKLDFFLKVIKLLLKKVKNRINIISGPLSKNKGLTNKFSKKNKQIKIFVNNNNLDNILSNTSLLISSSGMISLEAARYQIPSILFQISDNQTINTKFLEPIGLYFNLQKKHLNNSALITSLIVNILKNYNSVKKMIKPIKKVDGKGIKRIYELVMEKNKSTIQKKINTKEKILKTLIKINDKALNSYLNARNLRENIINSNSKKKIDVLNHYNWWLEEKNKEIKVLKKNESELLFIKNQYYKNNNKKYCINGWIKNDIKLNGLDVIWSLKENISEIKKKNKKTIIIGVAKKNNKFANFHTKFLGYKLYNYKDVATNKFINNKIKNLKDKNLYIIN